MHRPRNVVKRMHQTMTTVAAAAAAAAALVIVVSIYPGPAVPAVLAEDQLVDLWNLAPYVPEVKARAAVLMEPLTGRLLYARDEHVRHAPASITKIMTMLLALEAVEDGRAALDDRVVTSTAASQIGGSQIWLREHEEMSLADMLKAIAIVSANDASVAVAEHLAGSEAAFVDMMNRRATELGMKNTHFVNANGLPDPDHYTSAYDVALVSRELVTKHPRVLEWTSTRLDSLRGGRSVLVNTNELIGHYPGADGLKTGMTDEAGWCLSATAKREDLRLIGVIMGAESSEARMGETGKLLDFGFRNFELTVRKREGDKAGRVRVVHGRAERLEGVLGNDLVVLLPRGRDRLLEVRTVSTDARAPIRKGQKIGEARAFLGKDVVAAAPVVATSATGRANPLVIAWRAVRDFFRRIF